METRNCQNCRKDFNIEQEDFNFYEKIKVPPPTFCPHCRMIRRLASPNERVLYKRKCDLSGVNIFSMYSEDAPFPVYETKLWYSDDWDPYQYGMDYDFSRSFFDQFKELSNKVPRMSLVRQGLSVNSEYTHRVHDMKNSYMVFRTTNAENCLYVFTGTDIKDCADSLGLVQCELCYECIDCKRSYNLRFSQESQDCRDSMFLYASKNCSNCIGCVNLVNQEYCIFNKQYTKDEYFEEAKKLKLNTASGISEMAIRFEKFRKQFPHRSMVSIKSEKVSGNAFLNSENVKNSFWCANVKDGKYLMEVFKLQDSMDFYQWGNASELIYDSQNCGINSSRIAFSSQCWMGAHDLWYCDSCPGSGNCFGCIGLKKGEYSILNKKYTKEEYEELLPRIIEHMKSMPYMDGNLEYRFGEHFPNSFSEFAYNETAAQDFFPLTKEEAISKGFRWKDKEKKEYTTTISYDKLPETITEVSDDILKDIIACGEKEKPYSTGAYRITENELNFYRRMDLPLPRVCFDVRHKRRFEKRSPVSLVERPCSKCNMKVETVYTEEYAPILYCEDCYLKEIY